MPKNQPTIMAEMPSALRIERAPRGGFFVVKPDGRIPEGPVFACTDIDGALGFIKDELDPKIPAPEGIVGAVKWTEGEANAVHPQRCPHCGIPEGHVVDDRCTAACMARPEINQHGDIFK
jgi:hypothetical protein